MAQLLITPLEPAPARDVRSLADAGAAGQQFVHATPLRRIDAAFASSCGSQHEANEDAHSAGHHPGRVFVVADGVGGGAMARVASRQLVSHLHEAFDAHRLDAGLVQAAVLDADRAIAQRLAKFTDSPGAATLALCAPLNLFASKWLVAWVGDCRVYRLTMGLEPQIDLLTRDDTFANLGEAPPSGGALDDPARMVGNGAVSAANIAVFGLARGDLLAMCSDGVHKYLDSGDWRGVLQRPISLSQRCEELIALARLHGSLDDATVLLLQRGGSPAPRWIRRRPE